MNEESFDGKRVGRERNLKERKLKRGIFGSKEICYNLSYNNKWFVLIDCEAI